MKVGEKEAQIRALREAKATRPKRSATIPKRPPREWPAHIEFIHAQKCCIANRRGHTCKGDVVAAHARSGTDGGGSLKPSDWWTLPLCDGGHKEQHQIGEKSFEEKYGFKMKDGALRYARRSTDMAMKAAMTAIGIK